MSKKVTKKKDNKDEYFELDNLITSLPLFDYINIVLTDPIKYAKITDTVKRAHFFMLQRRLAIRYPDIVQIANVNGLDGVAVTDMYHKKLCNPRKPSWMFTKAQKHDVNVLESVNIDKKYELTIKSVFTLDRKTWDSIKQRNPMWLLAMVDLIDRSQKSKLANVDSIGY